jgi:hypothetical protein
MLIVLILMLLFLHIQKGQSSRKVSKNKPQHQGHQIGQEVNRKNSQAPPSYEMSRT